MRYAVSLFVFTVGAVLAFGVTDTSDSTNIQAIGVILMLTGLAGLATAYWLSGLRRRTDVIYRDDGVTLLEPNSPSPGGASPPDASEPIERRIDGLPPDGPVLPPGPDLAPGARVTDGEGPERPDRVEGVMNAEPGSPEFLQQQRDWM